MSKSTILDEYLDNLVVPSKFSIAEDDKSNKYTVSIEPFEKGFGITVGNALRRILLSSIPGFGISGCKIRGVYHEFGHTQGILEDTIDIILNLKAIVISSLQHKKRVIHIRTHGPCIITAKMISDIDNSIKVINPEQVICTITNDIDFEMDIHITAGRGYKPVQKESRHEVSEDTEVGLIYIDTIYTPVRNVSYTVEHTRIGMNMDYEKLVMIIETNGSADINDILVYASRILRNQITLFIGAESMVASNKPDDNGQKSQIPKILMEKIENLSEGLDSRARNCFKNMNVVYLYQLVEKPESFFMNITGFGAVSLRSTKEWLKSIHPSLKFGMEVNNWKPEDNI